MLSTPKKDHPLEPIMVLNPCTGSYFNVAPLFEMLHAYYQSNPRHAWNALDDSIRTIVLLPDHDVNRLDLANQLFHLYLMRDFFESIAEFKK